MPNPLPLVSMPADDLSWNATYTVDSEDADYPVTNLLDPDPAVVFKPESNAVTIEIETDDPAVVVGIALINTNATVATLDTINVPLPGQELDDQRLHAWRALTRPSASLWTVDLWRPSGQLWIGTVRLVTVLRPLNLRYGLQLGRNRYGDLSSLTRLGSRIVYGAQIRTRWAEGETDLLEDETMRAQLEASAKGLVLPFLFIPDENTNDAWWVAFRANDYRVTLPTADVRTIPFRVEELSSGPPGG